jgi:hypothetical protein
MKVISRTPVIVDNKQEIQDQYISPANGMGEYETTHRAYVDDYSGADAVSTSMDDYDGNGMGEYETVHREDGEWSNISGSSSKTEILAFQKYMVKFIHPTSVNVNGKWDLKTRRAWKKDGARYEAWKTKNVAGVTDPNEAVNPNGPGGTESTPLNDPNLSETSPTGQKKLGAFWDKTKGVWQKAESSGTLDFLRGFLSGDSTQNTQNQNWSGSQPYTPTPIPPNVRVKQPMSKGMKIGLAVGGVVLIGTIVYFVTRKKS